MLLKSGTRPKEVSDGEVTNKGGMDTVIEDRLWGNAFRA